VIWFSQEYPGAGLTEFQSKPLESSSGSRKLLSCALSHSTFT
jgi:hypothetical protein